MNKREIFDKVAKHLLDQGRVSMKDDRLCAYRGDNGLACAIGCLIPDELYVPSMEGKTVYTLMECYPSIRQLFHGHYALLQDLQFVHDRAFQDPRLTDKWEEELRVVLRERVLNEQA